MLKRGPIAPLSEEITDPDDKYVALGVAVSLLGLLVCLPYPFPFTEEALLVFSKNGHKNTESTAKREF